MQRDPIKIVPSRKAKTRKMCTCMHKIDIYYRDFYDRTTLAPKAKRELDVLRAISPAGSHLERQDTHIPA